MKEPTKILGMDTYDVRARLSPIVLVVVPIGFLFLAWFPGDSTKLAILLSLVVSFGLATLVAQLGRYLGNE